MRIAGEHVYLRSLTPSDLAKLAAWSQDPAVAGWMDGYEAPKDLHRRDPQSRRYAVSLLDGPLIGDAELCHIAWRRGEAELRICIGDRRYWGRGFGTDAVRILCGHAFFHLGLKRLYLRVFGDNVRAMRCYERCGFRREGRLIREDRTGKERVVFLMRLLRSDFLQASARRAS